MLLKEEQIICSVFLRDAREWAEFQVHPDVHRHTFWRPNLLALCHLH